MSITLSRCSKSFDRLVRQRDELCLVELPGQDAEERLADQRGFPRTAHARDGNERSERERQRYAGEIVPCGLFQNDLLAISLPPFRGDRDRPETFEIVRRVGDGRESIVRHGQRIVLQLELARGSGRDKRTAVFARTRTEIDHEIRMFDHLAIVFHDDERIPQIAQLLERCDQPLVVALMQADARFIQDIQHSDQLGADLRRQTDPLSLAARQRSCGSIERQIFQSDIHKELEPLEDLFDDRCCDHGLPWMRLESPEELQCLADGQLNDLLDRGSDACRGILDPDREVFLLQPAALALGTLPGVHVRFHPLPDVVRGGVGVVPLHRVQHTTEPVLVRHGPAAAVHILHREAFIPSSVQENLLCGLGDLLQRSVKIEMICLGNRPELVEHPGRPGFPHWREAPLIDGERIVREDQIHIQFFDLAQTVARRARTVRRVEGERVGRGILVADIADGTGKMPAVHHLPGRRVLRA